MLPAFVSRNSSRKTICQAARHISHYITTPIFYVNASPHIGHVHTLLVADASNIYQRLKSNEFDTLLSTGTDEHGIKVQTAALARGVSAQQHCDQYCNEFKDLFDKFDTTLTNFVRTTESSHHRAVHHFWTELDKRGFIYKSTYSGWYCTSEETFVPENVVTRSVVEGHEIHVDHHNNHLVWHSEENYMFKLTDVLGKVLDWLHQKKPVVPNRFNEEAIKLLESHSLSDISISRSAKRLDWGIKVPGDSDHTVYVWLDALVNYLTVVGYPCMDQPLLRWPIDRQVFGKDILKFHAIYWPSFLVALDMELPRQLWCHSHWLVDSSKMSKSKGNIVDPLAEIDRLTVEGLRYYLLRAGTPHSDTDYSTQHSINRVNSELVNTYCNLVQRCCSISINPSQMIPTKISDFSDNDQANLRHRLDCLRSACDEHFENGNFYLAIDEIMSVLRLNNNIYESNAPWKLVKELHNPKVRRRYSNIQAFTFECLRICSIFMQPIVPKLASRVLRQLGVQDRSLEAAKFSVTEGDSEDNQRPLVKPDESQARASILFPRLKPN